MSMCPQVAGARAERDTLADQNATLARTTHQLMAGPAADTPPGSTSAAAAAAGQQGTLSAPVSISSGLGDSSFVSTAMRQRAASDPVSGAAPGPDSSGADGSSTGAAGGATAAAQRITSGQLRDIGAMLARLTRENAALIKQRDKLEASAAEAGRAAAAVAAAAAERQVLLREQAAARSELEASRADCAKAAAAVKQLTAERDRLLQQVGRGMGCRASARCTI